MENLTFIILGLALIIVPITSKVCQVDTNGYWITTDVEFDKKYGLDIVLNLMNSQTTNLFTTMQFHTSDVHNIEIWSSMAGMQYTAYTMPSIMELQGYAQSKDLGELSDYLNKFNSIIFEAEREIEKVTTIFGNTTSEYRILFQSGMADQTSRFNNNTENTFSDIGDASNETNSRSLCVTGALRAISMVVEAHHNGIVELIKSEKTNPNSMFELVKIMKELPQVFNVKIIVPIKKCIDVAWVINAGPDNAKECIEPLLNIKGTDLVDTGILSEQARTVGKTSLKALMSKVTKLTDSESAKIDKMLPGMKKCFDQGSNKA